MEFIVFGSVKFKRTLYGHVFLERVDAWWWIPSSHSLQCLSFFSISEDAWRWVWEERDTLVAGGLIKARTESNHAHTCEYSQSAVAICVPQQLPAYANALTPLVYSSAKIIIETCWLCLYCPYVSAYMHSVCCVHFITSCEHWKLKFLKMSYEINRGVVRAENTIPTIGLGRKS